MRGDERDVKNKASARAMKKAIRRAVLIELEEYGDVDEAKWPAVAAEIKESVLAFPRKILASGEEPPDMWVKVEGRDMEKVRGKLRARGHDPDEILLNALYGIVLTEAWGEDRGATGHVVELSDKELEEILTLFSPALYHPKVAQRVALQYWRAGAAGRRKKAAELNKAFDVLVDVELEVARKGLLLKVVRAGIARAHPELTRKYKTRDGLERSDQDSMRKYIEHAFAPPKPIGRLLPLASKRQKT